MKTAGKVLVTGGSGLLGSKLILHLSNLDYEVTGLGRGQRPDSLKSVCDWLCFNLENDRHIEFQADILIHCAPLWLLPDFLQQLRTKAVVRRCIAMSSTSVIAKADARDDQDRNLAARLLDAEKRLLLIAQDKIKTTILRPALIYGYGKDKNITVIAQFIRKYGFFPVCGKADGLRQPVHVDDLVTAITRIIDRPSTFGKTYCLAGAQTMTYRNMLQRIFMAMGKSPRIIQLPLPLYRLLLAIRAGDYSPGSANRMNQNLNYDNGPAMADFNFRPQAFLTNPGKDLQ